MYILLCMYANIYQYIFYKGDKDIYAAYIS